MPGVMKKVLRIEFVGGPQDGATDYWQTDKDLRSAPAVIEDTITNSRYGRRGMKPTHTGIYRGVVTENWPYDYEGYLDVGSNQ